MRKINEINKHVRILEDENGLMHGTELDMLYQSILNERCSFAVIRNGDVYNVVTKEKSVIPYTEQEKDKFIEEYLKDEYYSIIYSCSAKNRFEGWEGWEILSPAKSSYYEYLERYKKDFDRTYAGYLFGTVSTRIEDGGFITTIRGKKDLKDYTIVDEVNHNTSTITLAKDTKPAPNAPLMAHIFKMNPNVYAIVMRHHIYNKDYETLPYYPSGTVRDSIRDIDASVNIDNHGSILLFDRKNVIITKQKTRR